MYLYLRFTVSSSSPTTRISTHQISQPKPLLTRFPLTYTSISNVRIFRTSSGCRLIYPISINYICFRIYSLKLLYSTSRSSHLAFQLPLSQPWQAQHQTSSLTIPHSRTRICSRMLPMLSIRYIPPGSQLPVPTPTLPQPTESRKTSACWIISL